MSTTRRVALGVPSYVLVAGLLAVALGGAAPAAAQVSGGQWELGFAVGSANIDSSNEEFDLDLRHEVRGGYLISDHFELEAQVLRAEAPLDAQLTAVMVNGVVNFRPEQRVVPYGLVGVGHYWLEDLSVFGSETEEDETARQAALGVRMFVGEERRMAVRLEASNLWLDTGLFDREDHLSLTAGLSWTVGR